MASEAKKQSELLATGFLNSLGKKKNFDEPLTLNSLEDVLIKYGKLFRKGFSDELNAADVSASGYLDSNIRFEFTRFGTRYETVFFMPDYAKFVDQGVQGINQGVSKNKTSPYKFRISNPSPAMVKSLEKWLKEKNVTAIITVPKGIVAKKVEAKSLAYALGKSIKQRGINATYFKKKTVEKLKDQFRADVIKAVGEDIKINILY